MFLYDFADDLSDALQLASNLCDWHPDTGVFIVDNQGQIVV